MTMTLTDLVRMTLDEHSLRDWKIALDGDTITDPEGDSHAVIEILDSLVELEHNVKAVHERLLEFKNWIERKPAASETEVARAV
jgi:hypothetical protein